MDTTETDRYTLKLWAAYRRAGCRPVVYRDGTPASISRVTTRNVFVRMNGRIQPVHPDDIRPANPNAVPALRRQGLLPADPRPAS